MANRARVLPGLGLALVTPAAAVAQCTAWPFNKSMPDRSGAPPRSCDYLLLHQPSTRQYALAAAHAIRDLHPAACICNVGIEHGSESTTMWSCEQSAAGKQCAMTVSPDRIRLDQRSRLLRTAELQKFQEIATVPSGAAAAAGTSQIGESIGFRKAILFIGHDDVVIKRDAVHVATLQYISLANDNVATDRIPVTSGTRHAVLGSGWSGLHALSALIATGQGPKLSMLFPESSPLAHVLPRYLSDTVARQVKRAGVDVRPFSAVQYVAPGSGPGRPLVELHTCKTFDALSTSSLGVDRVVLAPPPGQVWADTSLSEGAGTAGMLRHDPSRHGQWLNGLEVDADRGGIAVNSELAAGAHVFVTGSAASYPDPLFGRVRVQDDHQHDMRSALTAARNAVASHPDCPPGTPGPVPYSYIPVVRHDLGPLGMAAVEVGRCDAGQESHGYWLRGPRGQAKADALPPHGLGVIMYVQPAERGLDERSGLHQLRYMVMGVLLFACGPMQGKADGRDRQSAGLLALQDGARTQTAATFATRLVSDTIGRPLVPCEPSFGDPQASRDALAALLALPAKSMIRSLLDVTFDGQGSSGHVLDERVHPAAGQTESEPSNELLADPFARAKAAQALINSTTGIMHTYCPRRVASAQGSGNLGIVGVPWTPASGSGNLGIVGVPWTPASGSGKA